MNLNTQIKPILEDLNVGLIFKSLVFTILKNQNWTFFTTGFCGTLFGVKVTNKIDLDRGKYPPRQGFTLLFFLISLKRLHSYSYKQPIYTKSFDSYKLQTKLEKKSTVPLTRTSNLAALPSTISISCSL